MSKHTVCITGIDRMELLKNLWEYAPPAYEILKMNPPVRREIQWDQDEAKNSFEANGWVESCCGKNIRVWLGGESNYIDPSGYNDLYGEGCFEQVLDNMRNNSY